MPVQISPHEAVSAGEVRCNPHREGLDSFRGGCPRVEAKGPEEWTVVTSSPWTLQIQSLQFPSLVNALGGRPAGTEHVCPDNREH